jgi:hypothetical protein
MPPSFPPSWPKHEIHDTPAPARYF